MKRSSLPVRVRVSFGSQSSKAERDAQQAHVVIAVILCDCLPLSLPSIGKQKAFAYYRGSVRASFIPLTVILPGSVPSHWSFTEHPELLNYVQ